MNSEKLNTVSEGKVTVKTFCFSSEKESSLKRKNLHSLTHCSLETPKSVVGKQCKPRSDAAEVASDQGLLCLQIQLTLVISTSLISNNRLSRSENLVPAYT